jgi:hypothetical protein
MTTFQDPPPQSRRAVRQSERGEVQPQSPAQPEPYTFDASAAEETAPQTPATPPQTGRRAQQPHVQPGAAEQSAESAQQPPTGFEPLIYSTQGRVSPPADELSQSQPLAAAPPPGATDQAPFRVRDFSPEGGRRAAMRPSAGSPLASQAAYPEAPPAVELDYHTQGVAPVSHSAGVQSVEDPMNHTLSRRELRELRAAEEQRAPALQLPESIDTLLNSGPIDIPTLAPPPGQSQALAEAMAEFDLLTRARRESEARARDAQVASLATPIIPTPQQPVVQASVPQPPVVEQSAPQAPVLQVPVAQEPVAEVPVAEVPVAQPPMLIEPVSASPVSAAPVSAAPVSAGLVSAGLVSVDPVSVDPVSIDPVSIDPVPVAPVSADPVSADPVFVEPVFDGPVLDGPVLDRPVFDDAGQDQNQPSEQGQPQDVHGGRSPRASNHWRVQAAKEDDELPYENTLSRTVGSNTSAITTSALVLPSVPQPDSLLASLNSTGEILVTGSINLPRSLGSTGAHPNRVDNSDYEDDPLDSQVSAPDSAPVRAVRAVSTNTSTRGVIETKRPQGNRMLTAVIIVASTLCVGLVGLLVFAFATGKL